MLDSPPALAAMAERSSTSAVASLTRPSPSSTVSSRGGSPSFFPMEVADFGYAVVAAVVVGLLVGAATVYIRSKLHDPVLDTAISFVVPFIAFIPAEELGASGVLAVVVAGLYTGHRAGSAFSAQARINDSVNWHTVQLLLEHSAGPCEQPLRAETAEDQGLLVEQTPWGPAHRLQVPLHISGSPLQWALPASELGSHRAKW